MKDCALFKFGIRRSRSYLMLHCSETISSLSTLKVLPSEVALPDGLLALLEAEEGLVGEALDPELALHVPCTLTSCPTCFEKSSEPDSIAVLPLFSCSAYPPFSDWMQPWSVFSPLWLELAAVL